MAVGASRRQFGEARRLSKTAGVREADLMEVVTENGARQPSRPPAQMALPERMSARKPWNEGRRIGSGRGFSVLGLEQSINSGATFESQS